MSAAVTLETTLIRIAPRICKLGRALAARTSTSYRDEVARMLKAYFRFVRRNVAFLKKDDRSILASIITGANATARCRRAYRKHITR